MTLKLKLQTPPFFLSDLDLEAEPQAPFTLPHTHRSGDVSELQEELSAVIKRVVGESTSCSSSPLSPSSSPSPSYPSSSSPLPPSSPDETPPLDNDDDDDDDVHSNYGDKEDTTINPPEPTEPNLSISSPSSYVSLASSNPYVLDAEDLACRLSLISPGPSVREDQHSQDRARLLRQLDRAHASVKAEECAVLRVLRWQTRLS
ncbi:hypothetical protein F4801DRAFT_385478 [Xylaria longipes]|nr:hypothetical protein F4801DRAFT_385478 [Xylaria longipes]